MDINQTVIVEPAFNEPGRWVSRLDEIVKTGNVASETKLEKTAKDFESILILKVLEEMTKTIGQWGFEKDGAAEQIRSLFTLCLSEHIGDNGGLGLWEQIYKGMPPSLKAGENQQRPETNSENI